MSEEARGWTNYNLVLTFLYRTSSALADGTWDFSIGATFVYFLSGRSNKVSNISEARTPTLAKLLIE